VLLFNYFAPDKNPGNCPDNKNLYDPLEYGKKSIYK
jgi:hypothetical protein